MGHPNKKQANGNNIDHAWDQTERILKEIEELHYSIHIVERDMAESIQKIRQAANTFAEPRRRRLQTLLLELDQYAWARCAKMNIKQSSHGCPFETPDVSLDVTPIEDHQHRNISDCIDCYNNRYGKKSVD